MRIVLNTYEATKKIKTGVENHALQLIQTLKPHHKLEAIIQKNRKIDLTAQKHDTKSTVIQFLGWFINHLKVVKAFYSTVFFNLIYQDRKKVYREINVKEQSENKAIHPIYLNFSKVYICSCIYDAIKFRYWFKGRAHLTEIPRIKDVDAFWTTAPFAMYMKGVPNICTVHDTFINSAKPITQSQVNRKQIKLKYILEKYDLIFTVSKYTKNEIVKLFPDISSRNIHVCYQALPEKSMVLAELALQKALLKRLKVGSKKYMLHVSTLLPRKNQKYLIEAYLQSNLSIPLLMVGKKTKTTPNELLETIKNASPRVIWLNYLPDSELNTLYHHAKAFLLPSLYEGFGITLLEAFYHGCPVVTSNTSAIPEVAGDAALYVNPYSIEDIKNAIEEINSNEIVQQQLILAGKKQIKNFSNEAISHKINRTLADISNEPTT